MERNTDTWDSASNMTMALGYAAVGQIYRSRVCNTTSVAETLMAGTNVTLVPTSTIVAAGSCTNFALTVTNVSTPAVTIISG